MIKQVFCVTIILILILIAGCIPSLHPFYTSQTIIIDDRIEGDWVMSEPESSLKLDTIHVDGQYPLFELSEMDSPETMRWKFERAKNFTYRLDSSSSIFKLNGFPMSSIPKEAEDITLQTSDSFYILTLTESIFGKKDTIYMTAHLTKIGKHIFIDFTPFVAKDKNKQSYFASNFIYGHTLSKVDFQGNKMIMQPLNSDYIESLIKNKRVRLKHEVRGEEIVLTASTKELRSFIERYMDDPNLFDDEETLYASK